jgi:ferredoxin-NADP reductase
LLLPNGIERQYSLLRSGDRLEAYEIAVKRDPAGRGGSSYMHEHLKVGDVLSVTPPRNNFPLNEDAAHTVFFAGGIGITPILCMVRRLIELDRSWTLHYACRTRAEAAFMAEISAQAHATLHFDDEHGNMPLPIEQIIGTSPPQSHLYCCGPSPMLRAFEKITAELDIPPERSHVEYFSQKFDVAREGGFIVELARSGITRIVAPGQSILQVVRDAGISISSSCEEGICGACETKVLSGTPDHRDAILSPTERAKGQTMLICCSGCKTDRLILDL